MSTKKKTKEPKSAQKLARATQPAKGRRFTKEDKERALTLVVSGMKRVEVAKTIGTSTQSLRLWLNAAVANGTMPKPLGAAQPERQSSPAAEAPSPTSGALYAPKDPGQGLGELEQAAILELKKRHPSMGPAQIRAQLKRFKKWRLSIKAIARVLRKHGYEPVRVQGRPVGPQPVRFEAPRRNAMWQLDFMELRASGERQQLLVVLDDYSRFCVGHQLGDGPSAEVVIATMQAAIARHGKPEAVRTDRGGGFLSKDFEDYLEAELIDHVVGRAYHPQGGGKVESLVGTVRRELWDIEHFDSWTLPHGALTRSSPTTTSAARTWASTGSPLRTASPAAPTACSRTSTPSAATATAPTR